MCMKLTFLGTGAGETYPGVNVLIVLMQENTEEKT